MDDIQFSVDFVDLPCGVETPEETTVANLAIFVGDDCLTRNRPRRRRLGDPLDTVYGPIAGLVDWMIENWGPILWEVHTPFNRGRISNLDVKGPPVPGLAEAYDNWNRYFEGDFDQIPVQAEPDLVAYADWQHRHLLGHAASDLALPSIVILPEDRDVVISVDSLPSRMQASVEFVQPNGMNRSPTLFICNKTSFKQAAKDFINQALSRAASDSAYGYWVDWLKERWEAAQADEENHGRRLHWMLGDISAARIEVLRRERPPLADGLRQLLLDCRIVTGELELKPAEAIVEEFALKQDSEISRAEPPGWQAVGQENISAFLPEFAQGYQLARQLRRKLVLKSHPIDDLPKTLKRLDVEIEERMHTPLFRAAVCASRDKRAHIIPSSLDPRMDGVLGERFAITSALGRLLWKARGPDERICVAQGDQAMLSQSRRANAFAAEFLLPREAVENMRPEDYNAIGKISQLHGVSRASVKWHAYNVAHGPDHFWR